MKIDRLEFSIAATVAVCSVALIVFRRSALAVEVLIGVAAGLFLALVYFDWRRTLKSYDRFKSLLLSSAFSVICLVLAVTLPANLAIYVLGGLAVTWLVVWLLHSDAKPEAPPVSDKPEQVSTN